MYVAKTPKWIQQIFPHFMWTGNSDDKCVYLTFDDGPIPEITPWVLDQLAKYDAKATFFCVGENALRHDEIFERIIEEGHSVGNHTHNHLNGWNNTDERYLDNISKCAEVVQSSLFRPPYGKITRKQTAALKSDFDIVLWDVLSGDFDTNLSPEACLFNVLNNISSDSIVVFHDNLKAWERLEYVLPIVLDQLSRQGYQFKALENKFAPQLV